MVDAIKTTGDSELIAQLDELEAISESLRTTREATDPSMVFGLLSAFFVGDFEAESTGGLRRKVFDAEYTQELQKKLARQEGDPPHADPAVNEAYDGAGDTYTLLREVYGRDSLDGQGLPLVSSVHVRRSFNNAFWNGSQMAYGDGDGKLFTRFTQALTVIGHELAHGLVQFSGGLRYVNQSGALNEHIADVFGCLTEQFKKKERAEEASWLVGKEILAPTIKGQALRSMKDPGQAYHDPLLGKDPQPDHMTRFVRTTRDNGGVHINSGIPNRAFYLISKTLGGYAWEKAGKIWYEALQKLQDPDATFAKWSMLTVETAAALYGEDSAEKKDVLQGWQGVGVLGEDGKPTPIALETASQPSFHGEAPKLLSSQAETAESTGFWASVKRFFGWS
jgi:Zn-dependent metalloprotease